MYKYKSYLIKNFKEKQVIEFLKELNAFIDNEEIMSYRNNLKCLEGCVKNGR